MPPVRLLFSTPPLLRTRFFTFAYHLSLTCCATSRYIDTATSAYTPRTSGCSKRTQRSRTFVTARVACAAAALLSRSWQVICSASSARLSSASNALPRAIGDTGRITACAYSPLRRQAFLTARQRVGGWREGRPRSRYPASAMHRWHLCDICSGGIPARGQQQARSLLYHAACCHRFLILLARFAACDHRPLFSAAPRHTPHTPPHPTAPSHPTVFFSLQLPVHQARAAGSIRMCRGRRREQAAPHAPPCYGGAQDTSPRFTQAAWASGDNHNAAATWEGRRTTALLCA